MFVKTIPVYADVASGGAVDTFLQQLDAQISRSRENDLYSYADFCAGTKLSPTVLFGYQGDMLPVIDFCGCQTEAELMPVPDAKFPFELTVRRRGDRFCAYAVYRQDLFDDAVIRGLLESFDKLFPTY